MQMLPTTSSSPSSSRKAMDSNYVRMDALSTQIESLGARLTPIMRNSAAGNGEKSPSRQTPRKIRSFGVSY